MKNYILLPLFYYIKEKNIEIEIIFKNKKNIKKYI